MGILTLPLGSSDANQIDPERFVTVRAGLLRRSVEILDQNGLQGRLSQFRDEMREARNRVEHWTLDALGFNGPVVVEPWNEQLREMSPPDAIEKAKIALDRCLEKANIHYPP